MDTQDPRAAPKLSSRKALFFTLIVWVAFLFVFEGGARLVYFAADGFNPFYLTFGMVRAAHWGAAKHEGYTKFPPNVVRHQKLGTAVFDIRINANGFRGATDFGDKGPGTVRIAALGASSTFGYSNADDETYPYLLEQQLRRTYPERTIEVMNLGIPEFRLENILALAKHELPALSPDIVTLYAGANNATRPGAPERANALYRTKLWLVYHSVAWRVVEPAAKNVYYRLTRAVNRNVGGTPNLGAPVTLSEQQIATVRQHIVREYRAQVEGIANLTECLGATLVLVTQSYTLSRLGGSPLSERFDTYAEEVAHVEAMLRRAGSLLAPHATLLAHRDLMNTLRELAAERGLPLVEGIDAIDPNRHKMMTSWVHLAETGNAALAAAIHDTIAARGLVQPTRTDPLALRPVRYSPDPGYRGCQSGSAEQ